MEGVENVEDVFDALLRMYVDDLRSGELPKGKFIGKYMQEIRSYDWGDISNDETLKKPQVINHGEDSANNWIDYIMNMEEEEFLVFKKRLFDEIE